MIASSWRNRQPVVRLDILQMNFNAEKCNGYYLVIIICKFLKEVQENLGMNVHRSMKGQVKHISVTFTPGKRADTVPKEGSSQDEIIN